MWVLNHKEDWVLKNWFFLTAGLDRLLRVLWTARRSNQSILKEINPEYSLEGLMPKVQYFDHMMKRADSLEKTLMGWHWFRWLDAHWLNGHEFEQASGDWEGQGNLACCSPWVHKESYMTEQLNKNTQWAGIPEAGQWGWVVDNLLWMVQVSMVSEGENFTLRPKDKISVDQSFV